MDRVELLRSVYDDFFGPNEVEVIPKKKVEQNNQSEHTEEEKNEKMQEAFDAINKLTIEDDSKGILKRIITYVREYTPEKQYISFNMCIYTNNKETVNEVIEILKNYMTYVKYISNGESMSVSFYDMNSPEEIETIYNSNNSVIVFKNFEAFISREQNEKEKILHKIFDNVTEKKNVLTILCGKNKEELEEVFYLSEDISHEFKDFEIIGTNPDVQDLYQEILSKLENNIKLNDEMKIKLLDYISVTYPETSLAYPEYRDSLCEKILFNKSIPEYENKKTMDEIFAELNELVGLGKVKKMLRELVSLVELREKTKDDLKLKNINLHMVFLGNPGTGKTTVARIVAEILYNLKYIKQNKLIEVSSKDLVAEYVGQTAPKTMAVINKALGGVLFIDEAYSLASGGGEGNSYNEEAVATLIQAMENNRDNLVVIFAGYTKEMQDFLNLNSGIVSRIGYTVEFEDYTTEELIKIFMQMMHKAGFTVSKEAEGKAKEIIDEYKDTKNFGNARFVRNLYEKTIVKHASNTENKKDKKSLKTIKIEDISAENLLKS